MRVLFFGVLREAMGTAHEALVLPEGASAMDILARMRDRAPQLGKLWERTAIAVNQSYVPVSTLLRDGDEVALLPPVSGGAVCFV